MKFTLRGQVRFKYAALPPIFRPLTVSMRAIVSCALAVAGIVAMLIAVVSERHMQRHRRPGVTYRDVTLRKDGAWRNDALFTAAGLRYQRRASTWGVIGTLCWLGALVAWIVLRDTS